MFKINKIGILSVAKMCGLMYAILGFVFGAIVTISTVVLWARFGISAMSLYGGFGFQEIFRLLAVILLPIFYGIGGFVGGTIGAFVYNIAARYLGGIQFELQEVSKVTPTPEAASIHHGRHSHQSHENK